MMKFRLPLLLIATTLLSSCTQLLYTNYTPISAQMEGLSENLTPTEDPATGLYGYLGNLGLWVIKPQFKSASDFSNGMARVRVGSRYGAINPLGQWVIWLRVLRSSELRLMLLRQLVRSVQVL
ncbi:MAG: WG repeat-containing protein [Alistipes sp.]|nr:WG repeat-containing protein [Alistipes sp.]